MVLERYYTKDNPNHIFDMFQWKNVDVTITNDATGEILFQAKDLEFPEQYSQNACDIIAKMYFRKNGVPETGHEVSMKQVALRMVNFWAYSLLDSGIIGEAQKDIFIDELLYMLLNQMWAPNSPQWFNTGLMHAYGIAGDPSGHFYYDETVGHVVEGKDGYSRTQGSACFIVNVNDTLMGEQSLMENLTTSSRLFKYGSGIGSNWSSIRGVGEKLSGGGKSSGLLSFQKVFDKNAGAIKSGGVTRRAAVMQVVDIDHPDIFDFIRWKAREEDKVVALGKMGYDISISGDAYDTVSGQNVNNSIRIPDDFMEMLKMSDSQWVVKGRVDPSVDKYVDANLLWDELCWAAWRCGDPGVQFSDHINKMNTCKESGEIRASNPCSEFLFLDDNSCNLASINILKFYYPELKQFDLEGYLHAIHLIQLSLEATIHWGYFPTAQIAYNTHAFRPTGLGLTNLGALLMIMGVPYDSDEARSISGIFCNAITAQSYLTSAILANNIGPFPEFKKNKKSMLTVLNSHEYSLRYIRWNLLNQFGIEDFIPRIKEIWKEALTLGNKYGFRNAQVSLLAPTGTIAFAMDCDSTSSEPFFSHIVYKKLVDGSWMKIVNGIIPTALRTLNYTENQIQEIEDYISMGDGKIEGAPHLKEEHLPIFDTANRCGSGSRFLTPEAHVKMVAAIQPHVSGGISKTVNLPEESTIEDIKRIYNLAWELGCKCLALYRDGCKSVQPLTTTKEQVKNPNDLEKLNYYELLEYAKEVTNNKYSSNGRERLPDEPACKKNFVRMDNHKFHIIRSFYDDGRIGEIFVTAGKQGDTVKGLLEVLCIIVSEALQYGMPPNVISNIMRNHEFGPKGLVQNHPNIKMANSIPDLMSKFIDLSIGEYRFCQVKPENFIEKSTQVINNDNIEEVIYGETCTECGSNKIVKAGTCKYCKTCGVSTGCS